MVSFRLEDTHIELLDALVEEINKELEHRKTNKTEIVEKAIYSFACDHLEKETVDKIINKHYKGFF